MRSKSGFTNNTNQVYYAPAKLGFFTLFMSYMGLALAENPKSPFISSWIWLSGVPILLLGVALQILSRRVLWIRLYQALLTLHMSLIFSFAMWSIQKLAQVNAVGLLPEITLGLVTSGCFLSGYLSSANRAKKAHMPHGAIGVLNSSQGIVDPFATPKEIESEVNETENITSILLQWSPLFIGLLMAFTRILGTQHEYLIAILAALMGLVLGTLGLGGNVYYVKSILAWEQRHHKQIYVK